MRTRASSPKKRKFFFGYIVTAAGFSIWAIGWGTYMPSFGVFLKPLIAEFGWSRAETSLAYSLAYIVQAAMAIFTGFLTDRLGPRIVMMFFGSSLGICYLLMAAITSLWQFTMVYGVLGGLAASTLNVPVMVTISRWFVKRRAMMMGIVQAGNAAGGLVIPPLASWLILSRGWRFAYTILGIIALVGLFSAGSLLKRDPQQIGQLPDGEEVSEKQVAIRERLYSRTGVSLPQALRDRSFWLIAGIYGVFGFCRSTYTAHITAHVQDLGFSLTEGAYILSTIIGASVFGRVGLGRVADTIGNRTCFILSFAATAVSLLIALMSRDLFGLYVFAIIFGIAWGNQAVLRFAISSEFFGLSHLGVILGVLGVAESAMAALGSYTGGYIFDITNDYFWAFRLGIGIASVGMILAISLKPVSRIGE